MKKFLTLITTLLVAYNCFAPTVSFTVPTVNGAVNATNLINGPIRVSSLQIIQGALTANSAFNFWIFDSPSTNAPAAGPAQGYTLTTFSNGPVGSLASYTTNIAKKVTNFSGLVRTQTYAGIFTYTNVTAATTNNYRLVFTGVMPTTTGAVLEMPIGDEGLYFARGLTFTNGLLATNCTVIVTYSPGL